MRRYAVTLFGLGILLTVLAGVALSRSFNSMAELATGEGVLQSGYGDQFRIDAVAVFCREGGEAKICFITSGGSVYVDGRWESGADPDRQVDLAITSDDTGACISGKGTIWLQHDCVPISRVTVEILRVDGTKLHADFVEKKSRPCTNR